MAAQPVRQRCARPGLVGDLSRCCTILLDLSRHWYRLLRVKTAQSQPSPPWYPCGRVSPLAPRLRLRAWPPVWRVSVSEVRLLLSGQPWSAQGAPSHLRLSAGLRQAADTRYTQFSKYIILEILVWDTNFCFMYLSGGGGPLGLNVVCLLVS